MQFDLSYERKRQFDMDLDFLDTLVVENVNPFVTFTMRIDDDNDLLVDADFGNDNKFGDGWWDDNENLANISDYQDAENLIDNLLIPYVKKNYPSVAVNKANLVDEELSAAFAVNSF